MAKAPDENKQLLNILKSVDFFEKLKIGQLEELIRKIKTLSVPKGKTIIKEGDTGNAFYMIAKGRVSVWHKKTLFKKDIFLTYQGPGEFFGEMALVTNHARSATVIAEQPCEFYVLYSDDFKKILMNNAGISETIESALRRRLQRSAKRQSGSI